MSPQAPTALRRIEDALRTVGREDVKRILDLPCGYGRILRYLKAGFPDAEITACDLSSEAVDQCASTFGAVPAYSREDPREIRIDGDFDLIWCGSLLTHLNAERWDGFLDLFESLLAPRGVLVFSTHGRRQAHQLRHGIKQFPGLGPERTLRLLQEYDDCGFGFQNYRRRTNWGISLSSPSWVCAQLETRPGWLLISFVERAWAGQDVVACDRRAVGRDFEPEKRGR